MRVWDWVGGDEDAEITRTKLASLRTVFLCDLFWETTARHYLGAWWVFFGFVFTTALVASLVKRIPGRIISVAMVAAIFGHYQMLFPKMPNHYLAIAIGFVVLAFFDEDSAEERQLALQTCRWLLIIVLVYSGVQKFLHGSYFHGQLLLHLTAEDQHFTGLFQHFLGPGELDGLRTMIATGQPVHTDTLLFLIVSNFVWIVEIALGVALLIARVRPYAVVGAFFVFTPIALTTRETGFGMVFTGLTLLFAKRDYLTRFLPAYIALAVFSAHRRLTKVGFLAPPT